LLPLSFILIFAQSLFLSDKNKILFLTYFFTTVFALYSVEYIFLNRSSNDIHKAFAKKYDLIYDSRPAERVINDMGVQGIEVFPFSNGVFFEKDSIQALAGISKSNILHCNETGEWVFYNSDEFGFNNPIGSFDIENIQIVGIGDSFTNAYCISERMDFISLIKNEYPNTINLGMTGTGPLHQLAILKEYAAFLKPKILLWNFFEGNDLKELMYENQNYLLNQYLEPGFSQGLMTKQNHIDRLIKENYANRETKKLKVENNFNFKKFIYFNALRTNFGLYPDDFRHDTLDLNLLETIFINAKNITHAWGGKMIFVYIPSVERVLGFRARHRVNKYREKILDIVRKINIPLIDITDSILAHNDPLSLYNSRIGYHFNEKGNQLLSEVILDSLAYVKN